MIEYCIAVVRGREKLAENIFKLIVERSDKQEWKPGNFAMILPEPKPLFFSWRRAFSVFDWNGNELEFLIKKVGKITGYLEKMKEGDKISYIGPLGNSFIDKEKKKIIKILVAGGIGVAPIYFYARNLQERGIDFYFFYGAANEKELIKLGKIQNKILYATEDGSIGYKGNIIDLLIKFLERDKTRKEIFMCGPEAMLVHGAQKLESLDLDVYISMETVMACGFGVCRGCPIPVVDGGYKMVCKDGPIFNMREVEWKKLK